MVTCSFHLHRFLLLAVFYVLITSNKESMAETLTDTEKCEKFCIIYKAAMESCPKGAYGIQPLTDDICMSQCMSPSFIKNGTDEDFDLVNNMQCRQNHAIMAIQEGRITNSDHCRHACFDGLYRCDPRDPRAHGEELIVGMGAKFYYYANTALATPLVVKSVRVILAVKYQIGLRSRLWVKYPNPEIVGRTDCSNSIKFRTADGTCNNLAMPMMGSVGTPFVRTTIESAPHPNGMPNASTVAAILRRPAGGDQDPARQAPFNQLAVSWIQFMTHDWFQHNASRSAEPTQVNGVTHWWDASQVYGSSEERIASLRTPGGKILLDSNNEIDYDSSKTPKTGFEHNFWVGLHVMHTIVAREHNYIVDQLASRYSTMTDDEKFGTARLIVSATLAKIHTVEWTPTLLDNTMLKFTMYSQWYGILKTAKQFFPRWGVTLFQRALSSIRAPHMGIKGYTAKELMFNTSFFMTEEFVSVYRMHPLLPDSLKIGSAAIPLRNLTFVDARELITESTTKTLLRALSETPSNRLSLQNYPSELYNITIPGRGSIDLAAVDIMRDRERKLPRYNDARRQLLLKPYTSLGDLTDNPIELQLLESVYTDIEQVDLLVGSLVDKDRPEGFAFGVVPFHIFVVMASRRIFSDRFLQGSFIPEIYTQFGVDYVNNANFRSILVRHFPEYDSIMPKNPFMNWPK
jgi:Animal haem peroxidase